MTPADALRAAAAKLRKLAAAAHAGPWTTVEVPQYGHDPVWMVESDQQDDDGDIGVADCSWSQADAEYIAAMNPSVATALAVWLEAEATQPLTAQHGPRCTADCTTTAALAVARHVLGSTA